MIDRKPSFDAIRKKPFGGKLSVGQVDGITAILSGWEKRGYTDLRWLAYMLATAYHETAHTMRPIAEYGKGRGRDYGKRDKNGQVPYGRGYVQLTWTYNYERADKELGLNGTLVKNYDLALQPGIAADIMFQGMVEGWFTGKKLATYFTPAKSDWYNARRIINGIDKAALIGGYAEAFYAALKGADLPPVFESVPETPVSPPPAGDGLGEPEPMEPQSASPRLASCRARRTER